MSTNGTSGLEFLVPVIPFEVIPVPASRLHDFWDFIAHGLSYVRAQIKPAWIEEDVYAAIHNNRAELFVFKKGERLVAFVIGYTVNDPWTGTLEYFIWISWSIELADRIPEDEPSKTRQMVIDFMIHRARMLKCKAVSVHSPRKGWERFGFFPHMIHFKMPLEE